MSQSPVIVEEKKPSSINDLDCFHVSCREMAAEFEMEHLVDIIDKMNGNLFPRIKIPERTVSLI